jgi:hypothetical protein
MGSLFSVMIPVDCRSSHRVGPLKIDDLVEWLDQLVESRGIGEALEGVLFVAWVEWPQNLSLRRSWLYGFLDE